MEGTSAAAPGAGRSRSSQRRIHNPTTRRQDHRRRTRRRRPRCNSQRRQCRAAVVDLADGGAAVMERGAAGDAGRSRCSRCRSRSLRTRHRGRRRRSRHPRSKVGSRGMYRNKPAADCRRGMRTSTRPPSPSPVAFANPDVTNTTRVLSGSLQASKHRSHYLRLCFCSTQRARPPVLQLLFNTTRMLSGPRTPRNGGQLGPQCIPRHQLKNPVSTDRSGPLGQHKYTEYSLSRVTP